jgi:hypothetical protein
LSMGASLVLASRGARRRAALLDRMGRRDYDLSLRKQKGPA